MMLERARDHRSHQGFTLIEMLVAMGLAAVLMTLGASAIRSYWFAQALIGSRDEVVNELRRSQERAVSESNPKIQGVVFREGTSSWSVVEYDPALPAGSECSVITDNTLVSSTQIASATFSEVPTVTAACDAQISASAPDDLAPDDFAFFFARGSATNGTVTLTHPQRPESWTITVTPITGRVLVD